MALHLLTCPLGAQGPVPLASALCPRLCSGPLPLRAHHTSSLPPIFSLDLHTNALEEAAALCPANTQELSDSANFTRQSPGQSSEKTTYRLRTPPASARPRQLADPHKQHGQAGTFLPTSQMRRQRSRSFVAFPRLHQNLRPSLISCRGLPASVAET